MVQKAAEAQGCLPTVVLGQNLTICSGTSLTLNAFNPNSTYIWQNGSTDSVFTVISSGIYWVAVTNVCGTVGDSVNVNVLPKPSLNLGPDAVLCPNTSRSLGVLLGAGVSALWSTGQNAGIIQVATPGTYWITLTNLCGQNTDTIVLSPGVSPILDLGPDRVLCSASGLFLNPVIPSGHTILWSTGQTTLGIQIQNPGTYWATLSNNCGSINDTVEIAPILNADFLPSNAFLCNGNPIVLSPSISGTSFNWSNGSSSPQISVSNPGTYWLQYFNECGSFSDTTIVRLVLNYSLSFGADTLRSCGPLLLNPGLPTSLSYDWDDGSELPTRLISQSGMIRLTASTNCDTITDSVFVLIENAIVLTSQTLFKCPGQDLIYSFNPIVGVTYTWLDGGLQGDSVSIVNDGIYRLVASNSCGSDTAVFVVSSSAAALIPNLGSDTTTCDRFWIKPKVVNYNSILWSNNSTADSIRVISGIFWVQITNGCGTFTDTIVVVSNSIPNINLPDTLNFCAGQSVSLSVPSRSFLSYTWSNGDTSHTTSLNQGGWAWIEVVSPCNTRRDSTYLDAQFLPSFPVPIADLTICLGDTALASLPFAWNPSEVSWSSGDNGLVFQSSNAGVHFYTITNLCGSFTDSFRLDVLSPPNSFLPDTAFVCPGLHTQFNAASSGASTFMWSNGTTDSLVQITQPGRAWVTLTNSCGQTSDSVYLKTDQALPSISFGNDTVVCGSSLLLQTGVSPSDPFNILWSDSSSNAQLTINQSGIYWVEVRNSCQIERDSIQVSFLSAPLFFLANEFQFCLGSTLNVNVSSPASTYLWSNGDTTSTVSLNQPGTYWVQVINDCGTLTDTFDLVVAPPFQLNLGRDTVICSGDSLLLDAGTGYFGRTWNNGSIDQLLWVSQPGIYYVDAVGFCNTFRDSIVITRKDTPIFDLGPALPICLVGGSINSIGPPDMFSYMWSTGEITESIRIGSPGTYWLTVSNGCFSYTDSLELIGDAVPEIHIGRDTSLCFGESLLIGNSQYLLNWENGSSSFDRLIAQQGTYWASFTNSCGTFFDSINVEFQDSIIPIRPDSIICFEDTVYFSLPSIADSSWWQGGGPVENRAFVFPGEYVYYLENACGIYRSSFTLEVIDCECELYIPNSFSPNNDGINEYFQIGHACDLVDFRLNVYNRWGERVHQSKQSTDLWDGKMNGSLMPSGIYTVVVEAYIRQGERFRFKSYTQTLNLIK